MSQTEEDQRGVWKVSLVSACAAFIFGFPTGCRRPLRDGPPLPLAQFARSSPAAALTALSATLSGQGVRLPSSGSLRLFALARRCLDRSESDLVHVGPELWRARHEQQSRALQRCTPDCNDGNWPM